MIETTSESNICLTGVCHRLILAWLIFAFTAFGYGRQLIIVRVISVR